MRAVKGVDTVLLASSGPGTGTRDANVANTAAAAGAGRIVRISIAGVDAGDGDPVTQWHRAGEEAIDRVGIPRTCLRCGELMTTALWWAATIRSMRKVIVPYPDTPSAPIDPGDVATVTVRCLRSAAPTTPKPSCSPGPRSSPPERPSNGPDDSLGTTWRAPRSPTTRHSRRWCRGSATGDCQCRLDMIEIKSKGPGAAPSDTVETVTGRPPDTFDDWAAPNLAAFR